MPPRELPPQDHAALAARERAARRFTLILAGAAGAALVVVAGVLGVRMF